MPPASQFDSCRKDDIIITWGKDHFWKRLTRINISTLTRACWQSLPETEATTGPSHAKEFKRLGGNGLMATFDAIPMKKWSHRIPPRERSTVQSSRLKDENYINSNFATKELPVRLDEEKVEFCRWQCLEMCDADLIASCGSNGRWWFYWLGSDVLFRLENTHYSCECWWIFTLKPGSTWAWANQARQLWRSSIYSTRPNESFGPLTSAVGTLRRTLSIQRLWRLISYTWQWQKSWKLLGWRRRRPTGITRTWYSPSGQTRWKENCVATGTSVGLVGEGASFDKIKCGFTRDGDLFLLIREN